MRKRKEDIEETRQRIVEAAVELHGSVGPAYTTFSAIAKRAGVQRSTVYRHFEDEETLFGACTSHWFAGHPWPAPSKWESIADPTERLAHALRELYRYYDANREMLANAYRDIELMPSFVAELMQAQVDSTHRSLMEPWAAQADRRRLTPAMRLALDFRAWRSMDDAGLDPSEAADMMAEMVAAIA